MDKVKTKKPPTQPKQSPLEVKKLNDSAQLIIDQLPDHVGTLLETLSTQYQIPIWQYTAGVILAVHLEGRLSEFRLDPAWKDGLKTQELECKHCHKMFKPRHIGQPYCSNECGLAATGPKEVTIDEPVKSDDVVRTSRSADSGKSNNWGGVSAALEAA